MQGRRLPRFIQPGTMESFTGTLRDGRHGAGAAVNARMRTIVHIGE